MTFFEFSKLFYQASCWNGPMKGVDKVCRLPYTSAFLGVSLLNVFTYFYISSWGAKTKNMKSRLKVKTGVSPNMQSIKF